MKKDIMQLIIDMLDGNNSVILRTTEVDAIVDNVISDLKDTLYDTTEFHLNNYIEVLLND